MSADFTNSPVRYTEAFTSPPEGSAATARIAHGSCEPSTDAAAASLNFSAPAATEIVNASPDTKSVASEIWNVIWLLNAAPPTLYLPIEMPFGSNTSNVPAFVPGSMQTTR